MTRASREVSSARSMTGRQPLNRALVVLAAARATKHPGSKPGHQHKTRAKDTPMARAHGRRGAALPYQSPQVRGREEQRCVPPGARLRPAMIPGGAMAQAQREANYRRQWVTRARMGDPAELGSPPPLTGKQRRRSDRKLNHALRAARRG